MWVPSPYQAVDLKPMSQFQGARSSELLHAETFICCALADPFPEEGEEKLPGFFGKEQSCQIALAWGKKNAKD